MNSVFADEFRRKKGHIAASAKLNLAIVILLITNTIILGIEVDDQRSTAEVGGKIGFVLLEIFFATVFIMEWLVRLHQQRYEFFHDGWNVFDFSLVLMGFGDLMMTLFRPVAGVQLAKAFRVFRGLRVARSVKGVNGLGGLWFMIQGLLDSFKAVAFVACIAAVVLYVFAVSLTSVVATDPIVLTYWPMSQFYFGTIGQSMMTMLQVATLDSWAAVVTRPLFDLSPPAVVLLILGVVLLSFAIFNLLVAVMVKQITTLASDSKETSARMLVNSERYVLHRLLIEFGRYDQDNTGYLGRREFKKMIRQPDVLAKLSLLGLRVDEAE
ncbi:Scn10a, partial [Symbiodinium pilosum]